MKKIKALLYCCKAKKQKDLLWSNNLKHFFLDGAYNRLIDNLPKYLLNGTIPCECEIEVEEHNETTNDWLCMSLREKIIFGNMCEKASIDELECYKYANGKPLYAIHIKNLHIFDEPRELSDFNKIIETTYGEEPDEIITKAPQNMMRCCYEKKPKEWEAGFLISIQPQRMCLILNHKKDVEVRRVVLKEMLENEENRNL